MLTDDYIVTIVERADAEPSVVVGINAKTLTYVYSGDPSELVVMAQHAGEIVGRGRQIPLLLPTVE